MWLYPFTDYGAALKGERKVLAWRSPNQVGEYVVLRPTADSDIPGWKTVDGESVFPRGDSRRLPARIDHTETAYLDLVDSDAGGVPAGAVVPAEAAVPAETGPGEGRAYSVAVMEAAIERAVANRGALGMYCNSLMVNKALFGRLPEKPPAPLEDVIDAAVKTGADLSGVVAWNYENSRRILEARTPVPGLLHGRLSRDYGATCAGDKDNLPPAPRASRDHWLDSLERGVRTYIQEMIQRREELVARAMPPVALFESVAAEPEVVALGAGLNQRWAAALNRRGWDTDSRFEQARWAVEDYLAQFPPAQRGAILRGALVSVYGGEARAGQRPASDGAVWMSGAKGDGGREAGVGHWTVEALWEIGVLSRGMNSSPKFKHP